MRFRLHPVMTTRFNPLASPSWDLPRGGVDCVADIVLSGRMLLRAMDLQSAHGCPLHHHLRRSSGGGVNCRQMHNNPQHLQCTVGAPDLTTVGTSQYCASRSLGHSAFKAELQNFTCISSSTMVRAARRRLTGLQVDTISLCVWLRVVQLCVEELL
jgi:hypothetical protein